MSHRILVIDDEEHIRLLLRETLGSIYDVSLFERGRDAIEAVKDSLAQGNPFTTAITDLNMPEMKGPEVCRELLAVDKRINLILMTAESGDLSENLDPGVKDNLILLRKPFSIDEILMLTHYLHKSWHIARELEEQSLELQEKVNQREKMRASMAAIFDTALDCIITIDMESRVTEWNPAAEITFGWTRDEILGKTLTDTIIPSEYHAGHHEGMQKHLQFGGGPILGKRIEIVAQRKDGTVFPVELAVTEIANPEEPGFTAYLRDISEQRLAEQRMQLQAHTLEAAANGIVITDRNGRIVWANPAFLELTGYQFSEVRGKNPKLFKSGKHTESFYKQLWETVIAGQVWRGEIINKRKDGSLYIEDMTITPVTDPSGEIINFIAIKQDITERKEVSEQLVRSERNQRIINYFATSLAGSNTVEEILWDIASSCISQMGLEDAVVYLKNDTGDALVQRAAYGSNKAKDYKVLNPITIPIGQGIVGSAAAEKRSLLIPDLNADERYIVDDVARGSELAVPIIYENEVIGVIDSEHSEKHFYQDYHQHIFEAIASLAANKIMRIISQEKTEKSEIKYRSIFESIQDVYAELDAETGCILEISPSIEPLSGYKRKEMLGKPLNEFYAPPGPPPELWDTLMTAGRIYDYEVTLIDKWGLERTVSFNASVLKNELGIPSKIVGTMRDISQRKQAEKALQENLAIKTNFVSNVSHELRTPMASILGFAGTILRDKNMPEETKMDFVRIINDEAKRLTRLIENVLDISRMEAGRSVYNLAPTQLEDVIHEVVESQSVLAEGKGLEFIAQLQQGLPLVMAAPDGFNQVAVNIIGNAIKFTESPGTITVSLDQVEDQVVFTVTDTGLGIPEADLPRITEKFYRVTREKREDQGTGIGLAIVKEILDRHNAKLEIESKEGVGTTFRVLLPILN